MSVKLYCENRVQPEALTYVEFITGRVLFGCKGRFSPREYYYLPQPRFQSCKILPYPDIESCLHPSCAQDQ